MPKNIYTLEDLKALMVRLRDPESGCPWDLKQTPETIVSSTLEEVYEVVEAIENQDDENMEEELGDLLFQIVFYCQMTAEEDRFDLDDVITSIVNKLLRRHPHVFPDGTLDSWPMGDANQLDDEFLKSQWEAIKQEEKVKRKNQYLLDDVPVALPALTRAVKIQKKMASVGFDWEDRLGVFTQLQEEVEECQQALEEGDSAALAEELGDVLFSVVNLLRHLGTDPETVLRQTNHKITQRFRYVEEAVIRDGGQLDQAPMAKMEQYWQASKDQESGN